MSPEEFKQLAEMHAAAAFPRCKCPGCDKEFEIHMRESLDPYTVNFSISPMKGRVIDAKVIGAHIKLMARLFESLGDAYEHKTQSVLLGVKTDGDMTTTIEMAFIPRKCSAESGPND